MIGFDSGAEKNRLLDGKSVDEVHINLRAGTDVTKAKGLPANVDKSFMGDTKGGTFQLVNHEAVRLFPLPNPHARPNSDVIAPWTNAAGIAGESADMWIIDFPLAATESEAALYEEPFKTIDLTVRKERQSSRRASYRERWWIHAEPRPKMRAALRPLSRFFVTTITSKHRLFTWMQSPTLPDHKLIVFAFEDDYTFGLLHSSIHRVWTHADGSQVRERESGFTYIPTTNFLTFPFPRPTAVKQATIAAAAKELDALRSNWLNPAEWTKTETLTFPGSADGPWKRYVHDADGHGIGTVRYPRTIAKDEVAAAKLKKRTLTNLYNEMPTWLKNAHAKLDEAVFAAYGWPVSLSDDELLARLLALNLERAKEQGAMATNAKVEDDLADEDE